MVFVTLASCSSPNEKPLIDQVSHTDLGEMAGWGAGHHSADTENSADTETRLHTMAQSASLSISECAQLASYLCEKNGRRHATYTKTPKAKNQGVLGDYVGRTGQWPDDSGGFDMARAVRERQAGHHMNNTHNVGATLDKEGTYEQIRGREMHLADCAAALALASGAQPANGVRPVSKLEPMSTSREASIKARCFHKAALDAFGHPCEDLVGLTGEALRDFSQYTTNMPF